MIVNQVVISRQVGGAGLIALELSRRLASAGDVRMWIPGRGDMPARADLARLPWSGYSMRRLLGNPILHALECARIAGHWRRRGSLVHVHNDIAYRLLHPSIRLAQSASVAHVHIEPSIDTIRYAFRYPPDAIIVCADFLKRLVAAELEAMGKTTPVVSIANPVDIERFRPRERGPLRQALGIPLDHAFILLVGNLAPHKGQLTAIRAIHELRRRGCKGVLWLVGEERDGTGEFSDQLRQEVSEAGLADAVHLASFRDDVPELMSAADVVVLPSEREGLPLCLLEAQASKALVVASPIAGVPEIVADGVTGLLVAADDPRGYATAIERVLANQELRQRITDQAYAQAQRYSWERYVRAILEVYEYVFTKSRPSESLN
jgi:glycosyltransferase involved in cell wall biosynthesis